MIGKQALIEKVASRSHMTKAAVERVLESTVDVAIEELAKGESISIKNVGSLSVKYRAPRTGRNPHTKEAVPIPARTVVHFKPAKDLNERV